MVFCNCWCKKLSCQGYTLGPRPFLMNEIIICAILPLWMHYKNFYRVNLFYSSAVAMTRICQRSICIHQDCRNKWFMFTMKEVWDRVSSPENQFFNISSCKWPSTSCLKSFTWFWWGIDELSPIYYLISFFGHFLIWNSETRWDITIFKQRTRAKCKIHRNNYQDMQLRPSFAGRTSSVPLIAPAYLQRIVNPIGHGGGGGGGGSGTRMTKFTAAIQKPLILRCSNFVTFSFYL